MHPAGDDPRPRKMHERKINDGADFYAFFITRQVRFEGASVCERIQGEGPPGAVANVGEVALR